MFLPDRFIKGECPKCGAEDQYGDNCEVCGATYSTTELKNARSVVSGAVPIEKDSEHYFFDLPQFEKDSKIGLRLDTFKMRLVTNWQNGLIKDFSSGIFQEISLILALRYLEPRTSTFMFG